MRISKQPVVAFFLGLSLILAFAPFSFYPLAILVPMGLLACIINQTPKQALRTGFAFGVGFFSAGTYWLFISLHQVGQVPALLSLGILGSLVAVLASFPALTCYLTNRWYADYPATQVMLAFPALWVASEWLRSWVGDGFPWLFLGYSQTVSPLRGFAPLLSVYGVSLVTLMMSGLLFYAVLQFRRNKGWAGLSSLLVVMTFLVSGMLLSHFSWTKPNHKPLTVSLIQGDIPQTLKWSPDSLRLSFDRYLQLSAPWWGKSDLIIWPEAAIPLPLQIAHQFINDMDVAAKNSHTHLVLGIPVQNPNGAGFYNAMVELGSNKAIYQKRRLVPFGEYVPLAGIASHVLDFLKVPLPEMQSGREKQAPFMVGDLKINPSICFEIAFPELITMRDKQTGLLLSITNDAWFGHSIAQALHLQMAAMRAIELGRPLLLTSNDGLTAIINAHGDVTALAPAYIPTVLHGTVQPMIGTTPWMKHGIDALLLLLINLLFVARFKQWKKIINPTS